MADWGLELEQDEVLEVPRQVLRGSCLLNREDGLSSSTSSASLTSVETQIEQAAAEAETECNLASNEVDLAVQSSEALPKRSATDAVFQARKRVRLRVLEEVRKARKAKRKERKHAAMKRGASANVEQFLARTKERLESKLNESHMKQEPEASILMSPRRGANADIAAFSSVTRQRLAEKPTRASAEEVAREAEESAKAAEAAREKVDAFRKQTRARVVCRLWAKLPQVADGHVAADLLLAEPAAALFARRRIAVVGAGPVGLWAALLLARKYAHIDGKSRVRRPDAPEIVVLEARPETSHCSRLDIRIALSSSTQTLLNQRARTRCFSSGMPIAEIEEALLHRWRKIAPTADITFGQSVDDPGQFAVSGAFDCVLWAGGRRSLEEARRRALGCTARVGTTERVLVFQLHELVAGDVWQRATADLTGLVRQAARCPTLRVMLRPGVGGACAGWLWIFGLPDEAANAAPAGAAAAGGSPPSPLVSSLDVALDAVLDDTLACGGGLRAAAEALQQRLRPSTCTARWVEASFWSSDRVVCDLAGCPLVLLGDAACGKPFYTGTTLNRHFWDVAALVDKVDWVHDGLPLGCGRFEGYEAHYQHELQRVHEFQRRGGLGGTA
eukprot:gnl/TRDRNA2_/TRDRNA2_135814_c0_seq1.p1 gnl/TRDRNA2_/TRDRNA2_135814_c0~~gnl/TRDRNA2_/TRDRNA2_135814_c0_seq1.p1  ORF type:complete len:617 (-),score=96.50 gnl/TRDRNA2_/TRDRNA2_135814_c0_seq1:134-1984(-)